MTQPSSLAKCEADYMKNPYDEQIISQLAEALLVHQHFGEAAGKFSEALQKSPKKAGYWAGMGQALQKSGELKAAAQSYQKARQLDSSSERAFFGLASLLAQTRQFANLQQHLAEAPPLLTSFVSYTFWGLQAHLEIGNCDWASQRHAQYPEHFRNHPSIAHYLIRTAVYDPKHNSDSLLQLAKDYGSWHQTPHVNPRSHSTIGHCSPSNSSHLLNIAFITSRMRHHNMGTQLYNLLKARAENKPNEKVTLYLSNDVSDALTEAVKEYVSEIIDISSLTDIEAQNKMIQDQQDIIIEINEFTNEGRIEIFKKRVAPLQGHYLGNACSTGFAHIDFRISDVITDPPEKSAESTELVIPLKHGYHCYSPPSQCADLLSVAPANRKGHITFGGIHHLAKYSDEMLISIQSILNRLPRSRFLFARQNLEEPLMVSRFKERLSSLGVDLNRVDIRGDHGDIASLAIWNDIDCVLDSFPFGGDATTLDSLYAGVPIITMLGDRIAGRRTASILSQIGFQHWICNDHESYQNAAVELFQNVTALNQLRQEIRTKFRASSFCLHTEIATELFEALHEQCHKWNAS